MPASSRTDQCGTCGLSLLPGTQRPQKKSSLGDLVPLLKPLPSDWPPPLSPKQMPPSWSPSLPASLQFLPTFSPCYVILTILLLQDLLSLPRASW